MISRAIKSIKNAFCLYQTVNVDDGKISKFEIKNFADRVKLKLAAGTGGNGCYSFYTDKRVRRGQPDGGCGGKGGDIIVEAHTSVYDLSHLRRRTIEGNDGGCGGPRGKDGKNGGKTIIRVPCGTLIYQIQVHQDENKMQKIQKRKFLVDLDVSQATCLVAKGGEMGKGNKRFPYMKQDFKIGKQGQTKIIYLELKTLADVGLVGFPNIGKSTFLAAVTRALPKIANYQFTTLKPSIGYVKFVDNFQMTIADIPGIIEGAHQNKGLGFQFLRHIQRTKVLLFMLDITKADPISHLQKLQHELSEYAGGKLNSKQRIILFNKMDCLKNSQQLFKQYSKKIPHKSFLISAKEGLNVGLALIQIRKIIQNVRQQQLAQKDKLSYKSQQ